MKVKSIPKAHFIIYGLLISYHLGSTTASSQDVAEIFPLPRTLKPNVTFWKRVFTEISSDKGFIHDREHLEIVYEILTLPQGSKQYQNEKIRKRIAHFQQQLGNLSENPEASDPQLKKIASLWKDKNPDAQTYLNAARNVRFQRGLRDKFIEGLKCSQQYLPEMSKIFLQEGIPQDLVYLPHVESSFNCQARSRSGAVGIWQFLHETGKRYMEINHLVDERKDPLISTRAAAKLLKYNHEKLKSWPLALIAYNYGTNGMVKIIEYYNTNDFEYILNNHNTRKFGFASKNFYAEFLAARDIAKNPHLYFKTFNDDKDHTPIKIIYLEQKTKVKTILNNYSLTSHEFLRFNPSLTLNAIYKDYQLKEGYPIYLPQSKYIATRETSKQEDTPVKD